ncbi:hypothetical protein AAFF_G00213910 [Aldrovandia affinis]|uniref:Uncharacterized protein n=1 Tax=Aldrovandia affinis TaxID=143900 RepID=A0AAD7RGE0_9TELE|nr:hypothetical protein AAFF_G00213910 [Aldrovandia affinis]
MRREPVAKTRLAQTPEKRLDRRWAVKQRVGEAARGLRAARPRRDASRGWHVLGAALRAPHGTLHGGQWKTTASLLPRAITHGDTCCAGRCEAVPPQTLSTSAGTHARLPGHHSPVSC